MLNRILGHNVTFNEFIEAAKSGGDAGLATVNQYIQQNQNNVLAINAVGQYGNTALICAADNGHTAIVTALLARINNVNELRHENNNHRTAVQEAERNGKHEVVALIRVKGSTIGF